MPNISSLPNELLLKIADYAVSSKLDYNVLSLVNKQFYWIQQVLFQQRKTQLSFWLSAIFPSTIQLEYGLVLSFEREFLYLDKLMKPILARNDAPWCLVGNSCFLMHKKDTKEWSAIDIIINDSMNLTLTSFIEPNHEKSIVGIFQVNLVSHFNFNDTIEVNAGIFQLRFINLGVKFNGSMEDWIAENLYLLSHVRCDNSCMALNLETGKIVRVDRPRVVPLYAVYDDVWRDPQIIYKGFANYHKSFFCYCDICTNHDYQKSWIRDKFRLAFLNEGHKILPNQIVYNSPANFLNLTMLNK